MLTGWLHWDPEGTINYVEAKVQAWIASVDKLATAAESQPKAAYAALSKSLQFDWSYLQRILPHCDMLFAPLCDVINKRFCPSVFGGQISKSEQHLIVWEVWAFLTQWN